MPWMWPNMPSIQLAALEQTLSLDGIVSDRYEFFVDYAGRIGLPLYEAICKRQPISLLNGYSPNTILGPNQATGLSRF